MPEFQKATTTSVLTPGKMLRVVISGKEILLANVEGAIYATSALCSHEQADLTMGELTGRNVICPIHSSEFDLKTGEPQFPPAEDNLPTFRVRVTGPDVFVEV